MNRTNARQLRKNMTGAERALWKHIRLRQMTGHKFRRQQPVGQYVVDFVCLAKRLIIELDGGQHSQQIAYDANRSAWLDSQGFRILRFWNTQVLKEIDAVKEEILKGLEDGTDTPHPDLPPQGGKGFNPLPLDGGESESG
jgi:adenine-specific DNA-methyltransferase